eukprot:Rhum_TRINITY_DN23434_c0_g1::Rhum_TRINITY_DN23434_c0_g1_i1::g.177901::m.177901
MTTGVTERGLESSGGAIFDEATSRIPEKYRARAEQVRPILMAIFQLVDLVIPYVPKVWGLMKQAYTAVLPFWDEFAVFWGVVLTFFGGSFMMTVTTVEAFRLVGQEKIVKAWYKIADDVERLWVEVKKERKRDGDVTAKEWLNLALTCANPEDCREAFTGFYSGAGAVLACLRMQFAQVIALGASCGQVLEEHLGAEHITPTLKALVPEDNWKWVPTLQQIVCKLPAIIVAWILQRVIVAFHSATRGGSILGNACLGFLHKRSIVKSEPTQQMRSVVSLAFTVAGMMFQLSYGFGLPLLLAVPLFPFTIIEYILGFVTFGL